MRDEDKSTDTYTTLANPTHDGTGECIDGSSEHEERAGYDGSQVELSNMRLEGGSVEADKIK